MQKVSEDKNASHTLNFIITLSQTNNNNCSIKHISPIKCSFRPLFFSFLLLVIVLIITLSSQTILVQTRFLSTYFQLQNPSYSTLELLEYAAKDTNEESWKQQIQQLLNPNITTQEENFPIALRSPLFQRYFPRFQKALREWFENKRFEASVMSNLTHFIKHPIDKRKSNEILLTSEYFGQRYSSCAVVGNSGILLNTNYGKLIDSHELVIRLNNARVESFESKVGSKTNISFVNSNIIHECIRLVGSRCMCHSYGADVATIMYICQPSHFMDYTMCSSYYDTETPLLLLVTDSRFDVLCARIVKYYSLRRFIKETRKGLEEWGPAHDEVYFHYSSGFQALMLALGICDKVSMFGFGKSARAKHHYHTNQRVELGLHDYEAEYEFYRDLVDGQYKKIPFIYDKFKFPPVVMYQ